MEKDKSLTWEEIRELLGKPIWDNENKQWRVLYEYSETISKKWIKFTDGNTYENFKPKKLYKEEQKDE